MKDRGQYFSDTVDPFARHPARVEWGVFILGQAEPVETGLTEEEADRRVVELDSQTLSTPVAWRDDGR